MTDLKKYLGELRDEVNAALEELVPPPNTEPVPLYRAMRHSLFAGGKRLRPVMALAACRLACGDSKPAVPAACALEMVHTYSLIHDDLPAMDDDDFRRGLPTCHKVFGEGMAILAGDALLTMAFEALSGVQPPELAARLVSELSRASGPRGMVGGQVRDLAAEGEPADAGKVSAIHREKTAALIRAACRMGALSGGAGPATLDALSKYGERVGLAFQIADDVLDVTSTPEELGKTPGKDASSGKATYPAVFGLEKSRRAAAQLVEDAVRELDSFGEEADVFRGLARFVVERTA